MLTRWLAGALILSALAACTTGPAAPVEARSDLPRDTAPAAPPADVGAIANGNNAFALDLYQQLRAEGGNLFFSPYSLSSALAMTYAGARGDTEAQMSSTMHYTLPQTQLHPAFNALDLALTTPSSQGAPFTLRTANSLWGQDDFTFLPAFLDALAQNYGAGLQLVDFTDDLARERARRAINDWVAGQTEDKIQDLIAEGLLTQDTRLVLANAIYFQGDWERPFNAESPQGNFTLLSGESVSVTLMSRHTDTPYAEGDGYQAVALPYQGGRAEMLVIVPAPGAFESFEQSLTGARLDEISAALADGDVRLYVPRFSFESKLALADTLKALGMTDAFDAARSDFSGMTGEPNIVLSHVIHQAFVAVDEQGTEAAAATAIIGEVTSAPIDEPVIVRADRPFIFAIRDVDTGTVLFLGRVTDPR